MNHQMSVISSNCNGALILHDLAERFNSPFVNLYLTPGDFVKYLQNIRYYAALPLTFTASDKPYLVGRLGDIQLYFVHYHCEREAGEKWEQRNKRIDFDHLFIMMTERDGCTYEDLQAFDRLPFSNKVVFTRREYPEFSSAFYIKGFEKQHQVGDLFEFSGWFGKKYYDQFDYVTWFNAGPADGH